MNLYLGIDIGSVTIKLALIDEGSERVDSVYLRTQGGPIWAIQEGLKQLRANLSRNTVISGVGTTGSARYLAAAIVGGDIVKNEIHQPGYRHRPLRARGADHHGDRRAGQQDDLAETRHRSRFRHEYRLLAGTGSFLDHQAARLGIAIEDFGGRALQSRNPVRVSGKCTVFAESDMIQKQQMGHRTEDILYGLCQALAVETTSPMSAWERKSGLR